MNTEALIAFVVASATLIASCVSIGVILGVQKQKVDTLARDLNQAFRMIREISKQENEE